MDGPREAGDSDVSHDRLGVVAALSSGGRLAGALVEVGNKGGLPHGVGAERVAAGLRCDDGHVGLLE